MCGSGVLLGDAPVCFEFVMMAVGGLVAVQSIQLRGLVVVVLAYAILVATTETEKGGYEGSGWQVDVDEDVDVMSPSDKLGTAVNRQTVFAATIGPVLANGPALILISSALQALRNVLLSRLAENPPPKRTNSGAHGTLDWRLATGYSASSCRTPWHD